MTTLAAISDVSPSVSGTDAERPRAPSPEFEKELSRTQTDTGVETTGTRALVAPRKTPLTGSQAAAALEDAWRSAFGETPDKSTVAVLTAHWAHETGRGQSMLNFNFAGIKGTGPSGLGASYATHEGWGKTEVRTVDTFRAYRSADEGAKDYISLLSRKYPAAVEAARSGDAAGFVKSLKDRGYFTGNEDAYRKSVGTLSAQAVQYGFDEMGAANTPAPLMAPDSELAFSRPMDFRGSSSVPFDPQMGFGTTSVDPGVFYDEIARATLRIAGESHDEPRSPNSIF